MMSRDLPSSSFPSSTPVMATKAWNACRRARSGNARAFAASCSRSKSSVVACAAWTWMLSFAVLSAWLGPPIATADDEDWRDGRATFYGYDGGASIDHGSCMYGSLPNSQVSTGTNIAAISDQDDEFAGSCGRCYEVQCNPSSFADGYGNHIDRSSGCYDSSKTVTVTITDSCPCNYPANAYSNRRWCCGDMYHMDLSQQAFSQLADTGLGVIGVRYRTVDCPGGFVPSPRAATDDFPAGTRKRHRHLH